MFLLILIVYYFILIDFVYIKMSNSYDDYRKNDSIGKFNILL